MKIRIALIALFLGACNLTPQQDSALVKTSATLLCVLEDVEISDPDLTKMCQEILPNLTPPQQAALKARLEKTQAARAMKSDGGVK